MRPTLSNIGTATYGINKSLNKLLKLLSKSEYNISNREGLIRMLREEATPVGYEMSSFDVKNLCNDVPPDKAIDFISEKVYDEKKILINIPKTVLKELSYLCTKQLHFTFHNNIYTQCDELQWVLH